MKADDNNRYGINVNSTCKHANPSRLMRVSLHVRRGSGVRLGCDILCLVLLTIRRVVGSGPVVGVNYFWNGAFRSVNRASCSLQQTWSPAGGRLPRKANFIT